MFSGPVQFLINLADSVSQETGFVIEKEIYRGYYHNEVLRNIIFSGTYKGQAAVLKVYSYDNVSFEGVNQEIFNKVNTSKRLLAPTVFAHNSVSSRRGWLIMERLPEAGSFFAQPIPDQKLFCELYLEYRQNFPSFSPHALTLLEGLPAADFHVTRMSRWFEAANNKEAQRLWEGQIPLLSPSEATSRYHRAIEIIRTEFKSRQMQWCHGHFKPHELYSIPTTDIYYLTDFAHTRLYPEGYELAFIIWANCLISGNQQLPYSEWRKPIDEWMTNFRTMNEVLQIPQFDRLMAASLVERITGTLFNDIVASEQPREEQAGRIALLYRLFDDLAKDFVA